MEVLLVIGGLWFLASPLAFLAVLVGNRASSARVNGLERELFASQLAYTALQQKVAAFEAMLASGARALGPYRVQAEDAAAGARAALRQAWGRGAAAEGAGATASPNVESVAHSAVTEATAAATAARAVAEQALGAVARHASEARGAVARVEETAGSRARTANALDGHARVVADDERARTETDVLVDSYGRGTGRDADTPTDTRTDTDTDTDTRTRTRTRTRTDTRTGMAGSAPAAGQPPSGDVGGGDDDDVSGASIDWERWIGVRGAAALGAAVLVVAGVYFFRFSVEMGWLGPTLRVVLAAVAGAGCVAASELVVRSRHAVLANWLAGAGVAILYISIWAARSLFGLMGMEAAFGAMALVTAACVALSVRHRSQAIAMLGLMGGFATPAALSSGSDRPLALFGYVLILDAALLFVARRNRWPALAASSLAGTVLYQAGWMATRMGAERVELGIGVLLVFAAGFVAAAWPGRGALADRASDPSSASSSASARSGALEQLLSPAAILLPFAFGLAFAAHGALGVRLVPLVTLLMVLSVAASAVSRFVPGAWLATAAALAGVATLGAWVATHGAHSDGWTPCMALLALAALYHGSLELWRWQSQRGVRAPVPAGAVAAASVTSLGGLAVIALLVVLGRPADTAWLGAAALLGALALRQAADRGWLHLPAVAALMGVVLVRQLARAPSMLEPPPEAWLALLTAISGATAAIAHVGRDRWAHHATAVAALGAMVPLLAGSTAFSPWLAAVLGALLAAIALRSASVLAAPAWSVLATLALVVMHAACSPHWVAELGAAGALALHTATALLLVASAMVPALTAAGTPWPRRLAAFVPAMMALCAHAALHAVWARHEVTAGALFVAAVAIVSTVVATWTRLASDTTRRWSFAVAVPALTVAAFAGLEAEWLTFGLAGMALALLVVWRRFDVPAIKYAAALHLVGVMGRLLLDPDVLAYHERSRIPVFNWLLPTYGVPALALLGAWWLLRHLEVPRLRGWEHLGSRDALERTSGAGHPPLLAHACAAAAGVLAFAWMNLAVVDAFTIGPVLTLDLARMPSRDLCISLCWALYALGVLALGMRRSSALLRWTSLLLVLATCTKVFLYDLGHLGDLHRVAALLGLAASLIVVSVSYQRLVFRGRRATERGSRRGPPPNGGPRAAGPASATAAEPG